MCSKWTCRKGKNKTLKWKFYIDEPGEKWVNVSYSFQQNTTSCNVTIKTANIELTHNVTNTGKTVGEPNQNWVIDNFKPNRLGKINFPTNGFYTIELEVKPGKNDEFKFQWLWLK